MCFHFNPQGFYLIFKKVLESCSCFSRSMSGRLTLTAESAHSRPRRYPPQIRPGGRPESQPPLRRAWVPRARNLSQVARGTVVGQRGTYPGGWRRLSGTRGGLRGRGGAGRTLPTAGRQADCPGQQGKNTARPAPRRASRRCGSPATARLPAADEHPGTSVRRVRSRRGGAR